VSRALATLRVLLPQELWMQLRQHMTVVMVLVLPLIGLPAALAGTAAYQSTADDMERLTRAKKKYDTDNKLPVAVPDEAVQWIRETDGLVVVPPEEALATLTLDGRNALIEHSPTVRSTQARARLTSVVTRRQTQLVWSALDAGGVPVGRGYGLGWRAVDRATERDAGAVLIVPLSMLIMLMTAAFTALDVLTGERERGTLETLLSTGADRRGVILAKTLVVGIATLTSGWMGVVGVLAGGALGLRGVPALSPLQAVGLAVAVAALAVMAAALAVSFAISAPTYRSASLTMGAVLLVPAVPAGLGAFAFELTPAMAMIPIGNVSLAARDALAGTLTAADAAMVAVVSLGWTALAVAATVGRVGGEGALLQAHDASALRRAGFFGREAAGVFALALLLTWVVGSPVQAVNLEWGLGFTEVALIAGVGLAGVAWVGLPLAETLSLRRPAWRDLALAVVAGVCAPGIGLLALWLQEPVLPLPQSFAEAMTGLTVEVPWWRAVALFAVLPAVCEELMFRGALLGMMRRSPAWVRVLANAAMFGAIHLSVHRLLPTSALGLVIAVAAVRSGSLWPAVTIHLLNNALAVSAVGLLGMSEGPGPAVAGAMAVGAVLAVAAMGRRSA
jgi:sodium transport system permease protein